MWYLFGNYMKLHHSLYIWEEWNLAKIIIMQQVRKKHVDIKATMFVNAVDQTSSPEKYWGAYSPPGSTVPVHEAGLNSEDRFCSFWFLFHEVGLEARCD